MNVKELRDLLAQYPDDMPVMVQAADSGVDIVCPELLAECGVEPNPAAGEWHGEYQTTLRDDAPLALLIGFCV